MFWSRLFSLLVLGVSAGCEVPVPPARSELKVRANPEPKPVTGGTLLVTRDGRHAYAADADRARLFEVELASAAVTRVIALAEGEQPFRLVESLGGRVHVALRSGGVVTVSPELAEASAPEHPCASELRGLTFDGSRLLAACARGELRVRRDDGTWDATPLPADVRDVVATSEGVKVTRFRAAEVLSVGAAGVDATARPKTLTHDDRAPMEPAVAWRAIADPLGGVLVIHQLASTAPVVLDSIDPPYAGITSVACGRGVVHSALTRFVGEDVRTWDLQVAAGVLPVDVAVSADGQWLGIAAAGSRRVTLGSRAWLEGSGPCAALPERQLDLSEQPVAVAFEPDGTLLVQTREPTRLLRIARSGPLEKIDLDAHEAFHPGERRFHLAALRSDVSCASCHPEGGDDGRVWQFAGLGGRRTQPLNLSLETSAPFHWDGSEPELGALIDETFTHRMGDTSPSPTERDSLIAWLGELASPQPETPTGDALAGETHFASLGCAECHVAESGRTSHDVGTGGVFQAPSLVGVTFRSPLLHDGCAKSLAEVFERCGSGAHAEVTALEPSARDALLAYLRTR